jgi:hypothetical protein
MHCSADLSEERAAPDADGDGVRDGAETGDAGAETDTGPTLDPAAPGEASASETGCALAAVGDAVGGVSTDGGADDDGRLLAPDGLVDDTLTVLVGVAGGIVVGVLGTIVSGIVTGSGWAVAFGVAAWLGATAYLVRRRTVQETVARTGYAVAVVLLCVPLIALSPVVPVDGGRGERGGLFVVLRVFAAVPAGIAAAVGWVASRFAPAAGAGTDG